MKLNRNDLKYVADRLGEVLELLRNKNIFITGGTGFIGKHLLEILVFLNREFYLNIHATVLTRDYDSFFLKFPHLCSDKNIIFICGDVRFFIFPESNFDFVFHAATDASASLNIENPLLMADVILNGTIHTLDFAVKCKAERMLFLSSGAVYGHQPDNIKGFSEDYSGAPDTLAIGMAYGESKRMAENFCANYARKHSVNISIARCFAFLGPYLSLDSHFAVGNFINDGLAGRDIIINGDGTPQRTYMYSSDMIIWLLTILLKGNNYEAYNVGSDYIVTIKELAERISKFFPGLKVITLNKKRLTDRNQNYVPVVTKARDQFNFDSYIGLDEAIERTINFNKLS